MDECAGRWTSWITWTKRDVLHIPPNPPQRESDGGFVIQPHGSAATSFTGTHTNKKGKPHQMNHGQCVPSGGTAAISFGRDDDDDQQTVEDREYEGTLTTVGGKTVIHGKVKVFRGPGPGDGDTGVWDAEKTGTRRRGKGSKKGHGGGGEGDTGTWASEHTGGGKGHGKGSQKSGKGAGKGKAGGAKKR